MKAAVAPIALLLVALSVGESQAQTIEDRLRSQLVTVTNQLRELQAQQAAPPGPAPGVDQAALKAQLAAALAQTRDLRRQAQAAQAEVAPLQAKIEALTQLQASRDTALAEAQVANGQLTARTAALLAENERLKTLRQADARSLDYCRVKNSQALRVARYVLSAYDRVTIADVLARKEPVTGIARSRIEELEQNYGDRIYDSGLDAQPRSPATPSPPDGPPAAHP